MHQSLARRGLTFSTVCGLANLPRPELPYSLGSLAAAILGRASETVIRPQARVLTAELLRGGGIKPLLGVVLLSAGLLLAGGIVSRSLPSPEVPKEAERAGPPVDQFGDPLPEGVVARMGSTRLRHAGMSDYAWLPDSKTVLTSGSDRVLRYWDAATGKETRNTPLQGKAGPGQWITLSPDGKTLTTIEGNELVFWEVETGKQIKTLPAPKGQLTFLWLSPDGNTLAVGREDLRMTLWDWRVGKQREVRLAHVERPVMQFRSDSSTHGSFSPDGKWFVTGVHGLEPLGVFDVATGKEAYRIEGNASVSAVSPDSKTLVVYSWTNDKGGHEPVFRFFDLATGKPLRQFSLGKEYGGYSLAFSPDGKKLACGRSDNGFVMDTATGRVLYRLPDRPLALRFSPDGTTLAASTGKRLRFWDAATGKERLELPEGFGFTPAVAVSPDGRWLAAGDWLDHSVSLWDAADGRLLRRLRTKGRGRLVRDVAFLDGGKTLVACQGFGFLQFWDAATGKETRTLQLTDPNHPNRDLPHVLDKYFYYHLYPTADGKLLSTHEAIYSRPSQTTRAATWDLATGKLLHQQGFPGAIRTAAWSADGKTVTVPLGKELTMQDVDTGAVRFRAPVEVRYGPVASPDGRLLAAIDPKGAVHVYEAASGKPVVTLAGDSPQQLALAPDSRTAVTADSRSLRVWDLATGKERRRWALPVAPLDGAAWSTVLALVLSPDGRRAFTVLADGTALAWDLSSAPRPPELLTKAPTDADLAAWWADLGSADAGKAHAATWRLAEAPTAVGFVRKRLLPASAEEIKKIAKLVESLDSDAFEVREQATKRLEAHGGDVVPVLRDALARTTSLEARIRLERLLKRARGAGPSAESLRTSRAIQALEQHASPEARRWLAELGNGAPQADRTQQARAALARLAQSTGKGGAGRR